MRPLPRHARPHVQPHTYRRTAALNASGHRCAGNAVLSREHRTGAMSGRQDGLIRPDWPIATMAWAGYDGRGHGPARLVPLAPAPHPQRKPERHAPCRRRFGRRQMEPPPRAGAGYEWRVRAPSGDLPRTPLPSAGHHIAERLLTGNPQQAFVRTVMQRCAAPRCHASRPDPRRKASGPGRWVQLELESRAWRSYSGLKRCCTGGRCAS